MNDDFILQFLGISFYVIALTIFSLRPLKNNPKQKLQSIYGIRNFK